MTKPTQNNSSSTIADTRYRDPVPIVAAAIIAMMLASFTLASQLAIANIGYNTGRTTLAENLFGDARLALAAKLYTQADVYFHRGVPHIHERAFTSDIFQKIAEKVSPSKHVHVHGVGGIKEIMPWLDLSIKVNPQQLDSYLVAAFWLADEAKRQDLAVKVLNRAQQNMPYSYQVQLEKGRLLLNNGNHKAALQAFTAALAFWQKTAKKNDSGALLDKAQALLYRGLLLEEAGNRRAALRDFEEMASIRHTSPEMLQRIKDLKAGRQTNPPAHDLLASVLKTEDKHRRECHHHEHED